MSSEKEIKVIEVEEGDYAVEVTDSKIKIKSGPYYDPFLRLSLMRRYARPRSILRSTVIEEIPLKNINTISIEGNNLRITWIKRDKKSIYRMKETKIRMKPFKSQLIREAVSRIMKGEDPEKLAIEYSKTISIYSKIFQDNRNVIIVRDDYIEVYSKDLWEIMYGRIPLISRNPLFLQALTSYSEKIPIEKIEEIAIDRTNENRVKLKLNGGKSKFLTFRNGEDARYFIETIKRMMEVYRKVNKKTIVSSRGKLALRGRIEEKDEWKRSLLENITKFLIVFTIIYITISEIIGKSIELIIITTLISLMAVILWSKLSE